MMTTETLPLANGRPRQLPPPFALDPGPGQLAAAVFLDGLSSCLLVAGCSVLVAAIALLDYATGPYLSFSFFYLIPVAACAWWGGFSHGVLLSLVGAVAWYLVDATENPGIPALFMLWNGVVRFGTLVLTSSLVTRLHLGVCRERMLARTDALTGAANGRTFYEVVAVEAERAGRTARPVTLAYLDLDNFKQLNDRLGHAAGDAALIHLVATLRPQLRTTDLLARLGGDEFALLLLETDAEGAALALERLHTLASQELARKGWPVTLSIGAITFHRPLPDVDLMIQRVDALMYDAKRKGKARLEHTVAQVYREPAGEDSRVEKRSTARALCNRAARLRLEGESDEEFATVREISAGAIGLDLEKRFERDTLLVVEPLAPDAKTLLARVAHASPGGRGWIHECELSIRLSAEELRGWLGEHRC
jgi:diguanylate cyclase (GGDEF)-like protein